MNRGIRPRFYSFDRAQQLADEFRALLQTFGIDLEPGSSLERMSLSVADIVSRRNSPGSRDRMDIRTLFGDQAALTDLAFQVLQVRDHSDFDQLLGHLRLLNHGEASQNRPASQMDQAANKIFELLVACLAMRCGVNIELEPERSSGKKRNPDVLATIRGRRWGIACKVLHSLNPESVIQNIDKGIDQIEASEAEVGFVMLNLKNVIDHTRYWTILNLDEWEAGAEPIFSAFPNSMIPVEMLETEVSGIARTVGAHVGLDYLTSRFKSVKSLPGILLYAHVVCGVQTQDGRALPMNQKWPTWAHVPSLPDFGVEELAVVECFHRTSQDVPGG